ncbi:MAG: nitroreductase [Thermoproteota archaeon]|nr:MAG: nitroreductase [Candidatus Korarchaeota archaeon]RLG55008.1 MAG: nitroreductase [Candidatus Korarchaeota archaeon]
MEFVDVLAARKSVRSYSDRDVPDDAVSFILEAANSAPSAGDLQAYEIVVVRDKSVKAKLARAALGQWFIAEAPVDLVFLANPERSRWRYGSRGERLYCIQDATIAATFAMLAATSLGLGTCWVGAFDDRAVLEAIEAESPLIPVAIISVGYPAEEPRTTPRRDIRELASLDKLGNPYPYKPVEPKLRRPAEILI